MRRFPRPRVLVSACLEFEKVRYNGQVMPCPTVRQLEPYVDFVKVCPEYAIGLGVPRESVRMIRKNGDYRLVQPKTGRDITESMNAFAGAFLDALPAIDGFIFKSRSPTSGLAGAKVYAGPFEPGVLEKRPGFFTEKVIRRYPGYPMEEDTRLLNERIRHHFLTRLFAFAGLREALAARRLEAFHGQNRYLFMAYGREAEKAMAAFAREGDGEKYATAMKQLFMAMPAPDDYIGACMEAFRRYRGLPNPYEERWFYEAAGMYRANKLCINGLLEALKLFVVKYDDRDMEGQSLFEPYPAGLAADADAQRDKDYMKNIVTDLF